MWVAIRKAQGLSPNRSAYAHEDSEARVARHLRLLVRHEVKPNVPVMHPDVYTLPCDDLFFAKLRRWLLDERAAVRVQALDHLIAAYTEQREHRVRSLSYNFLPLLLSALLHDEQSELRTRAAIALELLVSEAAAQTVMLQLHADATRTTTKTTQQQQQQQHALVGEARSAPSPIAQLLCALDDASEAVVTAALRVCAACHAHHNAFALTQLLVQHDSVARVLRLLDGQVRPQRGSELRTAACTALLPTFDVKEAYVGLLQLGGVQCMTLQLREATGAAEATATTSTTTTHDTTTVDDTQALLLVAAARVLARACEAAEGRRAAVRQCSLSALLPCAHSTHASVRAAAAAAAAQVTVLEAAKMQAVDELHAAPLLAAWLQREDDLDVLLFLVRVLYHVAEYPPARTTLSECAPRLRELRALLHEHIVMSNNEDDDGDKDADVTGESRPDAQPDGSHRRRASACPRGAGVTAMMAIDATLRLFARA